MRSLSFKPPSWVTTRPVPTVLVVLLLTGLGLSRLVDFETGGPRLLLDPSVSSMLPADSEESLHYERIRSLFPPEAQESGRD